MGVASIPMKLPEMVVIVKEVSPKNNAQTPSVWGNLHHYRMFAQLFLDHRVVFVPLFMKNADL